MRLKPSTAIKLLVFFAFHFAATFGAPHFFASANTVTLFWPATGIALAAVLAGGWPYAFATLASSALAAYLASDKGAFQYIFAAANALEIFIARIWLLRIARIDICFDKTIDFIKFVFFAGVLLPIPATLIAAWAGVLMGPTPAAFTRMAINWWMGDSLGILLLTPVILIWRTWPENWRVRNVIIEALLGIVLAVGAGYILFGKKSYNASGHPYDFIFFVFVAWAAGRFGRHATLFITSVIVAMVIAGASAHGYLANANAENYVGIWLFLVTLSTVGMALATTFNERKTTLEKNAELLEAYRRAEALRLASNEALQKTSIDFQHVIETAAEGIWLIDTRGVTTFVNQRMAEMLGHSPSAMLDKNFLDFLPESERAAAAVRQARRIEGNRELFECPLLHRNGTTLMSFMRTNGITDVEGRVTGALAMVTDITDIRRTAQSLAETEVLYKILFNDTQDAIIIHQSGIIVAANPAAAAMIGAPDAASLIGRNTLNFVHPDDHAIVIERMKELAQAGKKVEMLRERFIRFNQEVIEVDVFASSIQLNGRAATLTFSRRVKPKN